MSGIFIPTLYVKDHLTIAFPHLSVIMYKNILSLISALLLTLLFGSCERKAECLQYKPVPVNITFSDFSYSFEDETASAPSSRVAPSNAGMSREAPSEAGINRISLSVFASDNTLAFSTTRNASVDVDNFEQISCSLLPGNYSFLAVLHKTDDDNEAPALIASTSQATLTTSKILKVFAVNQSVTIMADQTNDIAIDLGKCINSQFQLKTTDPTPANVASCEIIINPSASATSDFIFNPTTGLAASTYRYSCDFVLAEKDYTTFQNVLLGINCFLTENAQNLSITVNMKDASGAVVKTRTFTDVPMEVHRATRATGSVIVEFKNGPYDPLTTEDFL